MVVHARERAEGGQQASFGRAFRQAPWRKHRQILAPLAMAVFAAALFGAVYLAETSRAAVTGRKLRSAHPRGQGGAGSKGTKELEELLAQAFATRTRDEWVEAFQTHGVAAAPVYSYDDLADEPQCEANGYIVSVDDPRWGPMKLPGATAKFSATPPAGPTRGAPLLGEHTQDVLTGLAGYSSGDVARLKEAGAI